MPKVKKCLFTLNVDGFCPDLVELTFPYLKKWADKIEADFFVISERKFPDLPVTLEKFQIYTLAKEQENDWNIFFDADTLIHPEFIDVTAMLHKDTTCSYGSDFAPIRFRPDKYFKRDGRCIGKGNWCAFFSDWCLDYYHPLEGISIEEAVSNIFPTQKEKTFGITAEHLLDDWLVSRNIARYGLKHNAISEILAGYKVEERLLTHRFLFRPRHKVIVTLQVLKRWGEISESEEEDRLTQYLVKWGVDPFEARHIINFVKLPVPQPDGTVKPLPSHMWHQARWDRLVARMGEAWSKTV